VKEKKNYIKPVRKIIVVTSSLKPDNEAGIITSMFIEGLSFLHLKKHKHTRKEIAALLTQIPSIYHPQIIIHQHYNLINQFTLGGLHIPRRKRKNLLFRMFILPKYKSQKPNIILTTSAHSISSSHSLPRYYTYIFFSSIFDSIFEHQLSGYKDKNKLYYYLSNTTRDIVAMGGINDKNILELKKEHIHSIALHSVIWAAENPVEKFRQIRDFWFNQENS
jgi:thiamine-phosphate pyrophosphorylase